MHKATLQSCLSESDHNAISEQPSPTPHYFSTVLHQLFGTPQLPSVHALDLLDARQNVCLFNAITPLLQGKKAKLPPSHIPVTTPPGSFWNILCLLLFKGLGYDTYPTMHYIGAWIAHITYAMHSKTARDYETHGFH